MTKILIDEATVTLVLEALETITVDVKTTPTAYEAQRQAITALREALAKDVPETNFGNMAEQPAQQEYASFAEWAHDYVQDNLHKLKPAQQEPVAWMHKIDCDRDDKEDFMAYYKRTPGYCIPLYTTPQPAQQEPLPNDLQLAIESMIETYKAGDLDGWEVQLVKRGLRICAHNIKENA